MFAPASLRGDAAPAPKPRSPQTPAHAAPAIRPGSSAKPLRLPPDLGSPMRSVSPSAVFALSLDRPRHDAYIRDARLLHRVHHRSERAKRHLLICTHIDQRASPDHSSDCLRLPSAAPAAHSRSPACPAEKRSGSYRSSRPSALRSAGSPCASSGSPPPRPTAAPAPSA